MKHCRQFRQRDRRAGFALLQALITSSLLALVIALGYCSAAAMWRATVSTQAQREAHLVAMQTLQRFSAGLPVGATNGQFSNGFAYALETDTATAPDAALQRLRCTIRWETEREMPADPTQASHSLTLSTVRFSQ